MIGVDGFGDAGFALTLSGTLLFALGLVSKLLLNTFPLAMLVLTEVVLSDIDQD